MRGQLAGLWWAERGLELLMLVTTETETRNQKTPWLSGIVCLYVQEKSPTTGQSDGNNQRSR